MRERSSRLDIAANVAVILACLFAAATFGRIWLTGGSRPKPRTRNVVAVGDKIGPIAELSSSSKSRRLVLALSQTCRHCEESLPTLGKLTRAATGTEVIIVTNDPSDSTRERLETAHLRVDRVVSPVPPKLGISAFPTILLVDANNQVLGAWLGRPDFKSEEEIEALLVSS